MTSQPRELAALPPEVQRLVRTAGRLRDDHAESSPQRRNALWADLHQATDAVWNRPLAWRDHLAHPIARTKARIRRAIGRPDMR